MSFWGNDEFAVIMFSATHIRGAVFARNKNGESLVRFAEEKIDGSDSSAVWRQVINRISCTKAMPMFISGSFSGGIFFQTRSVDLPVAEQRGAIELELPRHLISVPKDHKLQFMTFESDEVNVPVNAYIFPAASIGNVAEGLSGCGRQTDGFIYPLMALRPEDPLFFNSEIEPGFCFSSGQWRPCTGGSAWEKALEDWKNIFSDILSLPADLDFEAFLPLLLVARLVSDKEYANRRAGLLVLPDTMRPRRVKRQLQLTAALVIALIVMIVWGAFGSWNSGRKEYNSLRSEIKRLSTETVRIQGMLRRQTRINKERSKIVSTKSGEQNVLNFMAVFSSLLPENVSVSNFRLNESGVDIVLASEVENLDLARVLKPMSDWKISQLQQRQNRGGSGNTINLKLVPNTGTEVKKGRRR